MSGTTYYDVLGVKENATQKEIASAFRRFAVDLHPDRLRNLPEEARKACEQRLADASEAYNLLKSAPIRKQYDAGLAKLRAEESAQQQRAASPQPVAPPPPPPPPPPYQPPTAQYQPQPVYQAHVQPAYAQQVYRPRRRKRNLYRMIWPRLRTVIGIALVAAFVWMLLNGRAILKDNPQWGIKPTDRADIPAVHQQWLRDLFHVPHYKEDLGLEPANHRDHEPRWQRPVPESRIEAR